jgi:hypothetical protein
VEAANALSLFSNMRLGGPQDGGMVNINPMPGSDFSSKYVEVIGRVLDGETLQEFKTTLFGENFDLETYDQFVQLAQGKFRPLFD